MAVSPTVGARPPHISGLTAAIFSLGLRQAPRSRHIHSCSVHTVQEVSLTIVTMFWKQCPISMGAYANVSEGMSKFWGSYASKNT